MKISVAFCTALAASFAVGAPIVRVFEDWPGKDEAPSTQLPPARHIFTTEIVIEKGFPDHGSHHPFRKHPGAFHEGKFHRKGWRRHNPWMRLLAWVLPPAHTGPKRLGHHSSMIQAEMGRHRRPMHHPTSAELEMEGARPSFHSVPCRRHGRLHFYRVRKYADMVIVSLVLTFIGVVVLIEIWAPICRGLYRLGSGEGSIRLPDEEKSIAAAEMPAEKVQVDLKCGSSDDASPDKAAQS